ncbi:hypothetical protein PR048_026176 [Dryococelus australis]|uniref:Uncharacterized protein n=1 Tax=Dryococelus australis TaxID=614101 RepID=A0ABQ9GKK7_9NEOP|nr:hypothetical protein PR048_026176 [Dryococelus australis]
MLPIPTLGYSGIVYSDISKELNVQLQIIQNSCIRLIFKLKHIDHIPVNCFEKKKPPYKKVLLTGLLPHYLSNMFSCLHSNEHNQNTSSLNRKKISFPSQ